MTQKFFELVIAILGVLKCGACYVPVDNNYNLDRKKYKLNYKFEMIYKIKPLKYILKEIKEDIEKINFNYRKQKNIKKEKIEELKRKEEEIKTDIKPEDKTK